MEYYLAIKRNKSSDACYTIDKVLWFMTEMNEMINEVSQRLKGKYCMIPLV